MIPLKNQTLYKCSYCGKRLLSKNGCKLHEHQYCKHYKSPHQQGIEINKKNCKHETVDTHYSYIPGEAVKEPAYNYCVDCGKIM